MESVIDFKRDVYQKALSELSRYLRRRNDYRPVVHVAERTASHFSRG
jgi:hypothetical protein